MTNATPPDMTTEHARELKRLHKEEAALLRKIKGLNRSAVAALRRVRTELERDVGRVMQARNREIKALHKAAAAQARPLTTTLHRITAGRVAEAERLRAVQKRVAVLEGRQ
jgi:uncharacterized protein involved in exopolysaccharide biosynthesis